MQELEKILEEIGEVRGQAGREWPSEDNYIKKEWEHGVDRVVGVIRTHLSRENDPEITRSSRDTQGAEHEINLPKEEFEILRFADSVTFRCGN